MRNKIASYLGSSHVLIILFVLLTSLGMVAAKNSDASNDTVSVQASRNPIGAHDKTSCGLIEGWAWDYDGGNPLTIHFYIDSPAGNNNAYLGQTKAGDYRADVPAVHHAVGTNSGWHYYFDIAPYQDGKTHTIYAYAINYPDDGNNPLLINSTATARNFTCQASTPAPVTVELSASPTTTTPGGATALTWSSTGATYCWGYGISDWYGRKNTSGVQTVSGLKEDTTFKLVCRLRDGVENEKSVTVKVGPAAASSTYTLYGRTTLKNGSSWDDLNGIPVEIGVLDFSQGLEPVTRQYYTSGPIGGSFTFSNLPLPKTNNGNYTHVVVNTTRADIKYIGYTVCYNTTTCHNQTPINTAGFVYHKDIKDKGFADIWLHFEKKSQAASSNVTGTVDEPVCKDWTVKFSGTATDPDNNKETVKVNIYRGKDNTAGLITRAYTNSQHRFVYELTTVNQKSGTVSFYAVDNNTKEEVFLKTIDYDCQKDEEEPGGGDTPPETVSTNVTGSLNEPACNKWTVTFSGEAQDPDHETQTVKVNIYDGKDNQAKLISRVYTNKNKFTYDLSTVNTKSGSVAAYAVDTDTKEEVLLGTFDYDCTEDIDEDIPEDEDENEPEDEPEDSNEEDTDTEEEETNNVTGNVDDLVCKNTLIKQDLISNFAAVFKNEVNLNGEAYDPDDNNEVLVKFYVNGSQAKAKYIGKVKTNNNQFNYRFNPLLNNLAPWNENVDLNGAIYVYATDNQTGEEILIDKVNYRCENYNQNWPTDNQNTADQVELYFGARLKNSSANLRSYLETDSYSDKPVLEWHSENAISCLAAGSWGYRNENDAGKNLDGREILNDLDPGEYEYILTCFGNDPDDWVEKKVTIKVSEKIEDNDFIPGDARDYSYQIVNQSPDARVKPGEKVLFWVTLKNVGKNTWHNNTEDGQTYLINYPAGQKSPYYTAYSPNGLPNWINQYKIRRGDSPAAKYGDEMSFGFYATAPNNPDNDVLTQCAVLEIADAYGKTEIAIDQDQLNSHPICWDMIF